MTVWARGEEVCSMKMESAVAGQPPLISLVVPVYNAGAWLDEAMASIRRQSF